MSVIMSIVNQKGGVGKTTTTINLAAICVALKKKVLVIDFDPQGNSSSGLGADTTENDIYKVLAGQKSVKESIVKTKLPNLFVLPCTQQLAAAEQELVSENSREYFLKNLIQKIKNDYDFIFIDCPPSLGLLTVNALVASTTMLIPLQCEFFSLQGLTHLLETYKDIKANLNNELTINGVILTMYEKAKKLTGQVENDVRNNLKDFNIYVYNNIIPRNVALSEATSHGVPVIIYNKDSSGAVAYMKFAEEMLSRF